MFKNQEQSQADELEDNTRVFWEVSRSFNGKSEKDVSTATAITICNETLFSIAPWRPLTTRFRNLSKQIIIGRSRKKLQPARDNVSLLHSGTK